MERGRFNGIPKDSFTGFSKSVTGGSMVAAMLPCYISSKRGIGLPLIALSHLSPLLNKVLHRLWLKPIRSELKLP